MLAVLDLAGEALAEEAKRHEATSSGGIAVEVIDRASFLAMRRLAASGLIAMAEAQVLHQSPDFAAAAPGFDPRARTAELAAEAERSLRMARVLATGGFAAEALPLIGKAIGAAAAARLAALGELPAGASLATPAQIRDLIGRNALAAQAEIVLTALWSAAGGGAAADAAALIEQAALVLAGLAAPQQAVAA